MKLVGAQYFSSVVGVCVAAIRLHAESAAVCDLCVTLAALTAQSHGVGEGRVNSRSTAWQLDSLICPVLEVTGVLDVWRHWAAIRSLLNNTYIDLSFYRRNCFLLLSVLTT